MAVLEQFRLDGKRVLITGGSRGLGRAMAQSLAEAGADLVLVGRDPETLQQAKSELLRVGRAVESVQADLFDPQAVERMCDEVLARHGPIHVLINNVGGRRENIPLVEQSIADWQKLMDLNLTSAFVCMKHFARPMIERTWGRIINIASICAEVAGRNIHGRHYETAKGAMVMLTRSAAVDWAPYGVTVNAISPGPFMTDANRRWFRERPGFQKEVESYIPMGRMGKPEELGPLAVYLASEASSFMTGAVLTVDGGYTLW